MERMCNLETCRVLKPTLIYFAIRYSELKCSCPSLHSFGVLISHSRCVPAHI